jgi:hypothetical protein
VTINFPRYIERPDGDFDLASYLDEDCVDGHHKFRWPVWWMVEQRAAAVWAAEPRPLLAPTGDSRNAGVRLRLCPAPGR